jgi:hypothetical protein
LPAACLCAPGCGGWDMWREMPGALLGNILARVDSAVPSANALQPADHRERPRLDPPVGGEWPQEVKRRAGERSQGSDGMPALVLVRGPAALR